MSDQNPSFDDSHVSEHFLKDPEKEGLHAITQQIKVRESTIIAYTDVDKEGNVGESGFDKKQG